VCDALHHAFNHQIHHRAHILDEMGVSNDFSKLISVAEIPA
jgi:uncharacterized damage-inducible protein DinB